MKKSDALILLNNMVIVLQKSRSIVLEGGIDETIARYFNFNPYILGNKCPLRVLLRVIESENFDPLFVYNMCVIFKKLEPLLDVEASLLEIEIPEPEASLLKPFEPEEG
jgi:hypothetical protein